MGAGAGAGFLAEPSELRLENIEALKAFARLQFDGTARVGKDTLADHIASAERQLGRKISSPAVASSTCPYPLAYIWDWFVEIRRTVGGNGFSPNPISFVDLDAWNRQIKAQARPWELRVILQLDDLFLEQKAKDDRRAQDTKGRHSGKPKRR